ncbi:hypothetical protein AC1031_018824 [Aphanomyces cochlioides]|nr:hypothetical protein AC1031_018824 [Aphanomyces cochlioides]
MIPAYALDLGYPGDAVYAKLSVTEPDAGGDSALAELEDFKAAENDGAPIERRNYILAAIQLRRQNNGEEDDGGHRPNPMGSGGRALMAVNQARKALDDFESHARAVNPLAAAVAARKKVE